MEFDTCTLMIVAVLDCAVVVVVVEPETHVAGGPVDKVAFVALD